MDFNSCNIFWGIFFGVLGTLITAGNVLTIQIFFKQRRQKRTYSLLMSLAVADLLVGSFAVPFYIKAVVSQGYAWYVISMGADVFTGTTSIYTLAVISLERMFAVGWPLRHRTVNYRVYICAISIPCIIAAIFTTYSVRSILNILFGLKVSENFHLFQLTLFVTKILQFSNSFVNVIIYPLRIPEFKRTLFQILNFCVIPFRRSSTEISSSAGTGSVVSLITFTNSTFSLSNVHQESSLQGLKPLRHVDIATMDL